MVRNVGSGPAHVESVALNVMAPTVPVVWRPVEGAPPLPATLGAGQSETWRFVLWHQGTEANLVSMALRAVVRTGDGRQKWSGSGPTFRIIRES